MKNCRKNAQKSSNGITLIALVITIIVLLILAGISISMLSGDNGILQQTTNAKTRTIHANVLEQMQLEASAYTVDKTTGNYSNSLIDYLKSKSIISDISGEEDKWLINVTTLLGSNQSMGIGTYPNDVYVLEKQETSTGSISNTKVAATHPIRIAATTTSQVTYNVKYYGIQESSNINIGYLSDNIIENEIIYHTGNSDDGYVINLFDESNQPTKFEKIYLKFNNRTIDISSCIQNSENYSFVKGEDIFIIFWNDDDYSFQSGEYEISIIKDEKEYHGTVNVDYPKT